jgi:hypothetical protein
MVTALALARSPKELRTERIEYFAVISVKKERFFSVE